MTATTITLRLEPQPPNALTEDELDALTRALARQLDAPELTAAVGLPDSATAAGAGAKGLGRTLGSRGAGGGSQGGPGPGGLSEGLGDARVAGDDQGAAGRGPDRGRLRPADHERGAGGDHDQAAAQTDGWVMADAARSGAPGSPRCDLLWLHRTRRTLQRRRRSAGSGAPGAVAARACAHGQGARVILRAARSSL